MTSIIPGCKSKQLNIASLFSGAKEIVSSKKTPVKDVSNRPRTYSKNSLRKQQRDKQKQKKAAHGCKTSVFPQPFFAKSPSDPRLSYLPNAANKRQIQTTLDFRPTKKPSLSVQDADIKSDVESQSVAEGSNFVAESETDASPRRTSPSPGPASPTASSDVVGDSNSSSSGSNSSSSDSISTKCRHLSFCDIDYRFVHVAGDGDCLLWAFKLTMQVSKTPLEIRQKIATSYTDCPSFYTRICQHFDTTPQSRAAYVTNSKRRTYLNNIEICALTLIYGVNIIVRSPCGYMFQSAACLHALGYNIPVDTLKKTIFLWFHRHGDIRYSAEYPSQYNHFTPLFPLNISASSFAVVFDASASYTHQSTVALMTIEGSAVCAVIPLVAEDNIPMDELKLTLPLLQAQEQENQKKRKNAKSTKKIVGSQGSGSLDEGLCGDKLQVAKGDSLSTFSSNKNNRSASKINVVAKKT